MFQNTRWRSLKLIRNEVENDKLITKNPGIQTTISYRSGDQMFKNCYFTQ